MVSIFTAVIIVKLPNGINPVYSIVNLVKEKMHLEKARFTMEMGTFIDIVKQEDIYGTWVDDRLNNDDEAMFYVAEIDEDTITLYVLQNDLIEQTLTWTGSFDANFDITKNNIIESFNYKKLTDDIFDASHREKREFKYERGKIKFKGESLGDYSDVTLKKWSVDCFYTFKLLGEREACYDSKKNSKIEFGGYNFEYPYYFDISDERSNDDIASFKTSDETAYASLAFRKRYAGEILNDEQLYINSSMDEYDTYVEDDRIIYTDGFLIDGNQAIMNVYYEYNESNDDICIMYNTSIMNEQTLDVIGITMCYEYKDKSKYDYIKDYKDIIHNARKIINE